MKKKKKKILGEIFCIFYCWLTQNPINQGSWLSWFFQPYRRLLANPKTVTSRELFLPENDFKTISSVNFPKKIRFWRPGNKSKTWNSDFNFFSYVLPHMTTYSKCYKYVVRGQNWKKSAKKTKKLNFNNFLNFTILQH